MLGNSIALLTLALMLASEGRRAEGAWRPGLYTLAVLVALMALALGPITTAAPVVGTTLSAIFGNPLAWFVLLMGLFFVIRPFWARPKGSPQEVGQHLLSGEPGDVDREFRAILTGNAETLRQLLVRVDKLEPKLRGEIATVEGRQQAIIEDYQRMLGMEAQLGEVRASIAKLKEEYTAHHSLNADALRQQFDNIYLGFQAVWHRERMQRLAETIEAGAAALSGPTNDPNMTLDELEYREWSIREEEWRDSVERWCELATAYLRRARDDVFNMPERAYRGERWKIKDNQFPAGSDAIHAYKSFRLIYENWKEIRPHVDHRVFQSAFDGQATNMRTGGSDK